MMWSVVMWGELTWFMWSDFEVKWSEVKWSEVSYGEVLEDKSEIYIRVTLYWGYLFILGLFHLGVSCSVFVLICTVVILYCFVVCGCVRMCGFCNVLACVCVCVGFVMCGYSSATLTEGFPCFFLSCKANARVKLAKTGHGPQSSKLVVICVVLLLFVLFYVFFVCKCVWYYCHWA